MTCRAAAATALVLLALGATTAASAAPTISQYQLPSSVGAPLGITSGREGDLWVTLSGGNRGLERITLSGELTNYPLHGGPSPLALTTDAEGNLWFTECCGQQLLATMNPLTGSARELQPTSGSNAAGIARGPEGAIWFLLQGGPAAELVRVDPLTGEGQAYAIPGQNSQPSALTFGPEGEIYFTESSGPGAVERFNPSTQQFAQVGAITPNSRPAGITTGPEGDIWFTETQPGAIGRLSPASGEITVFSSGLENAKPLEIITGTDGELYFTEAGKSGAIGQITPAGAIERYSQGMALNGEPWAITSGADGNIWFTELGNPGDVARLTIAPSVSSPAAAASGPTSATLSASVGANAQETSYYFEYGTTSAAGASTASASAGSGNTPSTVSTALTGLLPSTTYHFRAVAVNASGTTSGGEATFTTPAAPPAPATPQPQLGRTAALLPVSGSVLVKVPHAKRFSPLSRSRAVPVGSLVNAQHGVLRMLTALNTKGKVQAVRVWGGDFSVTQSRRGNGLTRLIMHGARPSCARAGKSASAHSAAKRSRGSRRGGSLWAEDNHGRYSTYGSDSVATVLGTKWETRETCAGTLTVVLRGRVRVHDPKTHTTVVVGAGHSFLARP